jgi:MFS family permease
MKSVLYSRRINRPGLFFAVAAVTVTAPRLALAFLAADGVLVPTAWRIDLLAISSVATAVVLTGGIAYLAHAIATAPSRRAVLIVLWTAALVCSGALIAPSIVATLRVQPLAVVLGVERHWSWSICVVLAVDLVASGAMLADARRRPADRVEHPVDQAGRHPLARPGHPVEEADWPALTPSAEVLTHPCPWGCGRRFTTKDAANGHGRHCPALAAKRAATPEPDGGVVAASALSVVRPRVPEAGDSEARGGSRS